MARDREYPELLGALRGKRVAIWTCNTCARLCRGMGGKDSAETLASRLSTDDVEVVAVISTGACCISRNAENLMLEMEGTDTVLALCCDIGSSVARRMTGLDVVNPVITFGPGYLDENGGPRIESIVCGNTMIDESLEEAADRTGSIVGPF